MLVVDDVVRDVVDEGRVRSRNRHHYRADDGSAEKDHDGVLSCLGLKHCRFDVGQQCPRQN